MKHLTLTIFILLLSISQSFSDTFQVNAGSYYYSPSSLTISVGDTVVWINDGGFHDVNGDISALTGNSYNNPESFNSNATNVAGAEIYTHVFSIAGTYNYDCSVGNHAAQGMTGTIVVEETTTVFDIIADSDSHNTLESALLAAGLDSALNGAGPFTVFAPSDESFDILPEGTLDNLLANTTLLSTILLHHVHAGELLSTNLTNGMTIETLNDDELTVTIANDVVKIDMSTVTQADIVADNGVVHVINMVLMPEIDTTYTVMDVVDNSPTHTTLKTALYEAGLDDDLRAEGPFTLFAPTDSAFDNLPAGLLDDLLDNIPALTEVLLHHVHGDEAMADDLSDGMMIPTLNNDSLTVTINGSTVMIDMSTVVLADIPTDNGVVHVIDMVLVPESEPASINTFDAKEAIYLYTLNILGEKINRNAKEKLLIDVYSNGQAIKRYNLTK